MEDEPLLVRSGRVVNVGVAGRTPKREMLIPSRADILEEAKLALDEAGAQPTAAPSVVRTACHSTATATAIAYWQPHCTGTAT